MLTHLTTFLAQYIPLHESKGIFFSCFDASGTLLNSHGVAVTDKPLEKVVEMLYRGIIEPIEKNIHHIVCHIITDTEEMMDIGQIKHIDITQYGIIISTIDHTKSGVLLPNTAGISDISQALNSLKQKHNITDNINITKISCMTLNIPL